MSSQGDPLPRFSRPPVVETVLGIYFRRLERFHAAMQGVCWDRCFRSEFPEIEERAPVEEIQERFGEDMLSTAFRWRVSDRLESPRLWAISESGDHILQIQQSALLTNWLKTDEDVRYRDYAERQAQFASAIRKLDQFFDEEKIGRIQPTSCVVTYINHVELETVADLIPMFGQILSTWKNRTSDDWLPSPDIIRLRFGYPMPDGRGRLNVEAVPAIRQRDQRKVLRLDLTARGTPADGTIEAALDWIDMGHEWVVRGFASVTEKGMHQVWGRTQ